MATTITQRYRELIEHLGRKQKNARGWQARAAEQLGISAQHLSRIHAGKKVVGWDLAQRAIERLSLPPDLFTRDNAFLWFLQREKGEVSQARLGTGGPAREWIQAVSNYEVSSDEIRALAKKVLELPVFTRAQKIARSRPPRTEENEEQLREQATFLAAALFSTVTEATVEKLFAK